MSCRLHPCLRNKKKRTYTQEQTDRRNELSRKRNAGKVRLYNNEQKERRNEVQQKRRKSDPERFKILHRRNERKRKLKRYGLTEETYKALLDGQGGRCGICRSDNSDSKRDWHVDHCHTTGKVRGILCQRCNLMIGHAKDNCDTLTEAIAYLCRHR